MLHNEYIEKIQKLAADYYQDKQFTSYLQSHKDICIIMENLNLDSAADELLSFDCPIKHGDFRDPFSMLRSLIVMALTKTKGITEWVEDTRTHPLQLLVEKNSSTNSLPAPTIQDRVII